MIPATFAVGLDGEDSGGDGGYEVFLPTNGVPGEPSDLQYDEPSQQPSGSARSVSAGARYSGNTRAVLVGYDPFGNPIYRFEEIPVLRTYYDLNIGWNTRAYVPDQVGPAGVFSFMAGAAVGAIVGLTRVPNASVGYGDIEIGYLIQKGVASILLNGAVLYEIPTATLAVDPGKYNPNTDHLEIRKLFNKVEFYITGPSQGATGLRLVATVDTTMDAAYFTAALYVGGDVINDERYWVPSYGRASIGLQSYGYDSDTINGYGASYLTLQSSGGENLTATGASRPSVTCFGGDYDIGIGTSYVGPIRVVGHSSDPGEFVIAYGYGISDLGPVMQFGHGVDIDIGNGASRLSVDQFGTDINNYGGGVSQLILRSSGRELANLNEATFASFVYARGAPYGRTEAYLIFSESIGLVGLLTADFLDSGEFSSTVSALSTLTYNEIIQALLASAMSAADVATLQQTGMSVWALHMDSMGSTRYEGFDFNSFMTIDGKAYGVNATGIHRLEGTTDDGDPILATVDFGSLSFGTNNRKALPYVYIGMSSNGKTVLKVESDGRTYFYTARDSTELMKAHRFEPGRGLRSTFYGLSITSDGDAFDLHNIDFQPVELKRSL